MVATESINIFLLFNKKLQNIQLLYCPDGEGRKSALPTPRCKVTIDTKEMLDVRQLVSKTTYFD